MARVLIAEDDPHTLRVLSLWLKQNGYQVTETRSGRGAAEEMNRSAPDLIISDVNMPHMSGMELASAAREKFGSGFPIIILTSRHDRHDLAAGVGDANTHFCPKPFSPSGLIAQVNALLATLAR